MATPPLVLEKTGAPPGFDEPGARSERWRVGEAVFSLQYRKDTCAVYAPTDLTLSAQKQIADRIGVRWETTAIIGGEVLVVATDDAQALLRALADALSAADGSTTR